ncbi:MAG TPA: PAS domain S-box protein, partial [Burkholderiaceae bacterium]|nr:PAS domain S-box protein [Burkholderiaceae bacterium]
IPGDVDRPLTDLASVSDLPSLVEDARRVLETLVPIERETHTADGESFLRRTLTYRTRDDRIEGVVVTFTDISELRAAAQELRRYGAVMQGSNDAVIVLDPGGRILAWNRGARAIYGRSAEEVLHTDLATLLPAGARDEFREHMARALAGERILGAEVRRCTKDGFEIDVSATFSLVPSDGKALPSVALTERDVSQRKQAETRLRESELRFRTMADDAPVLIWTAGRDGSLEFVNREFAQFVGRPETELLGSRLAALLHHDDRERTALLAPDAGASSERFDSLARLQTADGQWRWMKITAHRRLDDGGWVGSLIDVSDQVESEHTLRAADQRKDEFLAMLGHELRNPLVPIRNAAEVLNRIADVSDSRIGWVRDTLIRQVAHVTRLVDDLLDISAVTRGSMKLHVEPVDLRFLAERACAAMSSVFESKRHRFDCTLPDAPLWIQGDSVRLTQVFENLLSNAAKYTDEGGRIEMRLAREGDEAVLSVSDNGLGIDPSMLGRVFELFVQDERAIDRSEGGLGVGLALVRHFVELHNGRIEARSEGIGKGSEMTVRLPLIASVPALVEASSERPASTGKGRILIVDDDRDVGDSLRVLLQVYGFEAEHAANLHAALEAARRFKPQLALIDLAMPGADGIEVLKRLRLLPEMNGAHYLSLSGFGSPKDFARSSRAGFAHHLVKPVDPMKLIELCGTLIERP